MSDLFTQPPRVTRAVGAGSTQFRVWSNGMCSYRYWLAEGTDNEACMEFSLFSEVGEPFKPAFERIFRVFEVEIDAGAIELPGKPYIADKLLSMRT